MAMNCSGALGKKKERKIVEFRPIQYLLLEPAHGILCHLGRQVCEGTTVAKVPEASWKHIQVRAASKPFFFFLLPLNRMAHCKKDLPCYCSCPTAPSWLLWPHLEQVFKYHLFSWRGLTLIPPPVPLLTLRQCSMPLPWICSFSIHNNPN